MKKLGKIFLSDVKHLTRNVASIIIVVGLVVIPGLFTWFNVAACWDPFANTKNLKFAIANDDAGYQGDLLPMKINIGDNVVNALHENTQLDWTFTTSDKAIDGTKSGKFYAAVVIPKDFSKTMMTFFTNDAQHADLDYYINQKLNALAPEVTGQGADGIASQINQTFAKTITGTALQLASSLIDDLGKPEAKDRIANFNGTISDLASTLEQSSTALKAYADLTNSAQTLMDSSSALVKETKKSAQSAVGELSSAQSSVQDLSGALDSSVSALGTALNSSANSLSGLPGQIDTLMSNVDTNSQDAAKNLQALAGQVSKVAGVYQNVHDQLQQALDSSSLPQDSVIRSRLQSQIDRIGTVQADLSQLSSKLSQAGTDIANNVSSGQQQRQEAKDLAAKAKSSISGVSKDFASSIKPDLASMNSSFSSAAAQMNTSFTALRNSLGDLDGESDSAKQQLDKVRSMILDASGELANAGKQLRAFNQKLDKALNTGDMAKVKEVLGDNPTALATTLSAPVELHRKAIFPIANFGAALTPFYTFVPLWVGAILLVVAMKTNLSKKRRVELGNPKPWQVFFGHYLVFGMLALLQATFSLGGTLLFLRLQTVHPLLFMVVGWVSSLVYSFFTYTMVSSFNNVGKAICVIFLVMQISGSGGAYPLAILPKLISDISPLLPATYSVNASRAAIAGIYNNDLWVNLGKLCVYFVPIMILIGLVLRKPLIKFNRWFAGKLESTRIVN